MTSFAANLGWTKAATWVGTRCYPVPQHHKAAEAYFGADAVSVSNHQISRAHL
jgi:hypothetical protein